MTPLTTYDCKSWYPTTARWYKSFYVWITSNFVWRLDFNPTLEGINTTLAYKNNRKKDRLKLLMMSACKLSSLSKKKVIAGSKKHPKWAVQNLSLAKWLNIYPETVNFFLPDFDHFSDLVSWQVKNLKILIVKAVNNGGGKSRGCFVRKLRYIGDVIQAI